jgi:anti-sigma factor RsiW
MNCEQYDERLDDYVDGTPQPEFEQHLATCARCQALVADFIRIRRAASMLEEHVPPPRLWATIATSIEQKPRRFAFWMPVAVAASLAMLIAGATWLAWKQAPAPDAAPQIARASQDTVLPAEAQYEQAIAGLQQAADAQRAQLDPETRAVVQQNLAAIDRAIDESRAALASEPANTLAEDSLLDALETKVALLQDTVALTAEDVNQ